MQVHEAKILRTARGVPEHMRAEAERVLKLHEAAVQWGGSLGRGARPGLACSTEFVTLQPADVRRSNRILVLNLLLACDERSWLPLRGTWAD